MPDFGPRWIVISDVPLGKGGQGQVYRVRDAQNPSGPEMAAKVLSARRGDSIGRQRLEHEIAVAKRFSHPNVVKVVDSGHR